MNTEVREGAVTMKRWNEFNDNQKQLYFLFLLNLPTEMLTPVDKHIIKIFDQYPVQSTFDIVEG
jgi:hypothetical protein